MLRAASLMVAAWLAALPASADEAPQMPRDLPEPVPQVQQVPQALPQRTAPPVANGDYMLDCRSSWMTLVFLIHPSDGMVEVVSSFPQWQGTLFESDSEYVIAFTRPRTMEFVISRYTGRMTAVEDGLKVLATGVCRKRAAKTLF